MIIYLDMILYVIYSAGINFQALVDHTVLRLLEVQHDVINSFVFDRLILRSKVSFDGSTGQSIYTQVTDELENRSLVQEASLFLTCFVPLELTGFSGQVGKIVWRNPHPSSTLYCRIVRFRFVKETTDIMNAEDQFLENAIGNLTTTPVPKYENLTVLHKVDVTMIDGKVATALSTVTNSSQCCSVCGSMPSQMNQLNIVCNLPLTPTGLKYCLSTLHAWIRSMECLLKVGYKTEVKKWALRSDVDKEKVKAKKNLIQSRFRNEVGLVIDIPRSGGSGSSNNSNTARRFFRNAEQTAPIINVDVHLIKRIYVVLCTLSSGFMIDADKLKDYCLETAQLFIQLYPWYYIPQSLHKILIHGWQVVD